MQKKNNIRSLFTIYREPIFYLYYFFVSNSISLTMSTNNATNKDAKEHTNVKAS